MSKRLPKKARSASLKWGPATGGLDFGPPRTGDYDVDNAAAVEAAKTRLGDIERLLAEPHSSSGLTNKQASLLAREKRQLEALIRQYGREYCDILSLLCLIISS